MKRKLLVLLALLLCFILAVSLTACGGDDDEGGESSSSSTSEKVYFSVTFNPNYEGAPAIEPRDVQEGKKIGELPEPEREGWIFEGWYAEDDTDFETKYTSSKKVTEDLVLVAKWSEEPPCAHETGFAAVALNEPTCDKDSILIERCRNPKCGFVRETKLADALGHNMKTREPVPANCINAGYTKKECIRPGCPYFETIPGDPPTGIHSFPESWQDIKIATDYAYGEQRRGCKICGELEYRSVEPNLLDQYDSLPIKNVVIGGKTYVNVAGTATAVASSLYRTTLAANAIDGAPASFWRADALVEKETFIGDVIEVTMPISYEVARIEFTIPNYWAWKLGEDCTVSYDIEIFVDNAWVKIGTISDTDAHDPTSKNAVVALTLATPTVTNKVRATVTHATRFAPAMIYEMQIFGYVEEFVRVPKSIATLATGSITGSYNSWVNSSAANLLDGSTLTSWCTDARVWTAQETLIYTRSPNNITNGAVDYGMNNKQTVSKVVVNAGYFEGETLDVLICRAWTEPKMVEKKVQSTDASGNPLFDENGDPIMETVKDPEGNTVMVQEQKPKVDKDGNPVLNPDGSPVMEDVWLDQVKWYSCGVVEVQSGVSSYTFTPKDEEGSDITLTDVVMVRVEVDNFGSDENKDFHTVTSMTVTTSAGDKTYNNTTPEFVWTPRKKVYATLTFPQAEFIAYIDIVCAKDVGRVMSLQFWVDDPSLERGGYWDEYKTIEVLESSSVGGIATFTVDVGQHVSKIRLEITKEPAIYGAYIYDISPYTVSEVAEELPALSGCPHKFSSPEPVNVVAPTCTTAGYSVFKCFSCEQTWKTDHVDMTGHKWGQGTVDSEDRNKVMRYSCTAANCGATKVDITEYRTDDGYLAVPTVTKYYHNAPAAWSFTFDDGNYIDTYEWVIPELQKRNFKATAVITVQYSGSYTYEWERYIASGVFDIGSHSQLHAGDFAGEKLDESGMMKEIDEAHFIFMSWFPGQRVLGFATPNGKTGAGTANMVNDLMIGGRSGGQGGMYCDPDTLSSREQWGNLPSFITYRSMTFGESSNWSNNDGAGDIKACIDHLVEERLWTADCVHTIDTSPNQTTNDKFSIRKDTMIKKLDYLEEKGVWVGSYTQALQYFREAHAAEITDMSIGATEISFKVTDGLDDIMFVQPLTFKFTLPTGWTDVTVTQNGVEIPVVDSDDYSPNMDKSMACTIINGVLYFDAVPDAGTVVITKK